MKDWETASAGSRSLPVTPKKRPPVLSGKGEGVRSADVAVREGIRPEVAREVSLPPRVPERVYVSQVKRKMMIANGPIETLTGCLGVG